MPPPRKVIGLGHSTTVFELGTSALTKLIFHNARLPRRKPSQLDSHPRSTVKCNNYNQCIDLLGSTTKPKTEENISSSIGCRRNANRKLSNPKFLTLGAETKYTSPRHRVVYCNQISERNYKTTTRNRRPDSQPCPDSSRFRATSI
jgi:hypothetical protein